MEKLFTTKHATENAVAAKLVAEKRVQELTREAESTATARAQKLKVFDAETNMLMERVTSLVNKADGSEYELDGGKVRLQQMQSRQQNVQSALSRVKYEISALAFGLEKDRDYSVKHQDANCECMFVELEKFCMGR